MLIDLDGKIIKPYVVELEIEAKKMLLRRSKKVRIVLKKLLRATLDDPENAELENFKDAMEIIFGEAEEKLADLDSIIKYGFTSSEYAGVSHKDNCLELQNQLLKDMMHFIECTKNNNDAEE